MGNLLKSQELLSQELHQNIVGHQPNITIISAILEQAAKNHKAPMGDLPGVPNGATSGVQELNEWLKSRLKDRQHQCQKT